MSSSRRRARAKSFTDSETSYLLSRLVLVGIADTDGKKGPPPSDRSLFSRDVDLADMVDEGILNGKKVKASTLAKVVIGLQHD